MTALVVAAHPDDETLGAGGTVARLARVGRAVHWLVLGEGTTSRAGGPSPGALAEQDAACRRAASMLGVASVDHRALPDNRFDTVALLDIVRIVEEAVASLRPSLVITHHGGDANVDHRRTHEAVLAATRPLPGGTVRSVLAFEVPSSTEWSFSSFETFTPDVFVDVSETLEAKLEALACYAGEARQAPHPRSPAALRALAAWRGATAGVAAAEAFQLVRAVR